MFKSAARLATLACVALALTACLHGYRKFYESWPTAGNTVAVLDMPRQRPAELRKIRPSIAPAQIQLLMQQGYLPIGSSSLAGRMDLNSRYVEDLATQVGADVVLLLHPGYPGLNTANVPVSPAIASLAPFPISRIEYGAIYLVKSRQLLGAYFQNLDDEARRQAQQSRGVVLSLIVDGTPAFSAGLVPGDILLTMNGDVIVNAAGFKTQVEAMRGKTVTLTVNRGGTVISKTLQLAN